MAKAVLKITPLQFSQALLEKGLAKAVLGLKRLNDKAFPALITKPENLEGFDPLFPIMPSNMGRSVSRLTTLEPSKFPVAVFLRPCELRAAYELTKLNQAHLENILFIGIECIGVTQNSELFIQGKGEELYSRYLSALKEGKEIEELRKACTVCEFMYPETADMVFSFVGRDKPTLILLTEKGEDIAKNLGFTITDAPEKTELFLKLQAERQKKAEEFYQEVKEKCKGIDGLLEVFWQMHRLS